jgi:cytochrome c oxidase cbb3-type subunit 3/ubiquinol-cytochrome c reductase cytochrome c subunit
MIGMRNAIGCKVHPVTWSARHLVNLSLLLLAGCDLPGRPKPADRPVPADRVLDFGVLYARNCAGCHGADGTLGPAPPLNDPLFRAIIPEEQLEHIVTNGRKMTLMPAFAEKNGGHLTAAQIQVLVNEIKGISYKVVDKEDAGVAKVDVVPAADGTTPKWGIPEKPPGGAPSYSEPPTNAGDKTKGAAVFARACAACHGDHGQGIARENKTVRTINDRVFLALTSNQALRRFAITGRPDLGMPSYAQPRSSDSHFAPLTDPEIADLVALLDSWRRQ